MNNKTQILFVSPLPPPFGGIASWTNSIVEWSKNNYKKIGIINTSKIVGEDSSPSTNISFLDQLKRTKTIFSKLTKELNDSKYDVVHINSSGSFLGLIRDFISIKISSMYCDNIVLQLHFDVSKKVYNDYKFRLILKKLINLVDLVWVLNSESYKAIYPLTKTNKIELMPNFVKSDIVAPKPTFNSSLKNVGFLGSISKQKGIMEILLVAKKFKDIDFHLIGPIADESLLINKPNNIILYGGLTHQKSIELLRKMDVFLFPSYSEGFSISILEAMAQGLPIITTPVGANKELLNKGGLIVDVGNTQQIIEGLNILKSSDVRKKMGEININLVKRKFTSEIVIKNIFLRYEKLINKE